jgi:hypothetical protein
MKCMKYDRVDLILDSEEMPIRVFIGYVDGRNLGNVEYKDENLFSSRLRPLWVPVPFGGLRRVEISLSYDPMIDINKIGLRNYK